MSDSSDPAPAGIDLDRPNAARIYDYLLGGEANWAIDRAFGEQAVQNMPLVKTLARTNREFLGRAVRYSARNGVRQFLDIGSGVPTVGNVHEAADAVDSDSRCVYVDYEPVAVAHSRVLLEEQGDPRRHAVVSRDMRDVQAVWQDAVRTGVLDPQQPIGLIMVALLHFMPPELAAHDAVEQYRELLPAGSHLIISHVTEHGVPHPELDQIRQFVKQYEESSTPACFRTPSEIAAFFGEFAMVDPGVVWLPDWRIDEGKSPATADLADNPATSCVLGGVGRKA